MTRGTPTRRICSRIRRVVRNRFRRVVARAFENVERQDLEHAAWLRALPKPEAEAGRQVSRAGKYRGRRKVATLPPDGPSECE